MRQRSTVFILLVCFTGILDAQVIRLDDLTAFSEESLALNLGGHHSLSEERDASHIFSFWGVTFSAGPSGIPLRSFAVFSDGINITPGTVSVIANHPLEGTSAGVPFLIDFRFPLRRCAFTLANSTTGSKATLTAFDWAGNRLGAVDVNLPGFGRLSTVGIETSAPQGISRISVDYGESEDTEQISHFILDYLDRPVFRIGLAHLADVPFGDGRSIHTTVSILNRSNTTARGEVVFLDRPGDGSSPPAGETLRMPFAVEPLMGRDFDTDTLGITPFVGSVRVISFSPMSATATYRVTDSSGIVEAQAGISGDAASTFWIAPARKKGFGVNLGPFGPEYDEETAIAVANFSGRENPIRIILVSEIGSEGDFVESVLPSRGQQAGFLSELFPKTSDGYVGTVRVSAAYPVVVTVLQTRQGLPLSSLPARGTTP